MRSSNLKASSAMKLYPVGRIAESPVTTADQLLVLALGYCHCTFQHIDLIPSSHGFRLAESLRPRLRSVGVESLEMVISHLFLYHFSCCRSTKERIGLPGLFHRPHCIMQSRVGTSMRFVDAVTSFGACSEGAVAALKTLGQVSNFHHFQCSLPQDISTTHKGWPLSLLMSRTRRTFNP